MKLPDTVQVITIKLSDVCDCEPFHAKYDERGECLHCHKPRPVVVQPEDTCPVCKGAGCDYCSWGCEK